MRKNDDRKFRGERVKKAKEGKKAVEMVRGVCKGVDEEEIKAVKILRKERRRECQGKKSFRRTRRKKTVKEGKRRYKQGKRSKR